MIPGKPVLLEQAEEDGSGPGADCGNNTVRVGRWAYRLSHAFGSQPPAAARVGRSALVGKFDKVVYPDTAALGPSLSRDGRRVAVYRLANGNMDVWSVRKPGVTAWDRITFDSGDDITPSGLPTAPASCSRSSRQSNTTRSLPEIPRRPHREARNCSSRRQTAQYPMDWSVDGRFLLYDSVHPKRGFDMWALPLEGEQKPFEVVQTGFNEGPRAVFSRRAVDRGTSPTRRVALRSTCDRFLVPELDSRASTEGGAQARWNPNGKELFYVAADDRLDGGSDRASLSNDTAVEPGQAVGVVRHERGQHGQAHCTGNSTWSLRMAGRS